MPIPTAASRSRCNRPKAPAASIVSSVTSKIRGIAAPRRHRVFEPTDLADVAKRGRRQVQGDLHLRRPAGELLDEREVDNGAFQIRDAPDGLEEFHELAPIDLPTYNDGSPIYTFYLAEAATESEIEKNWKWKLRPEVSKAIAALGLDA